jgi:hypothetical protein
MVKILRQTVRMPAKLAARRWPSCGTAIATALNIAAASRDNHRMKSKGDQPEAKQKKAHDLVLRETERAYDSKDTQLEFEDLLSRYVKDDPDLFAALGDPAVVQLAADAILARAQQWARWLVLLAEKLRARPDATHKTGWFTDGERRQLQDEGAGGIWIPPPKSKLSVAPRDLLKLSDFTPGDLWEAATEDDLAEFKRTVESAAAGFAKAKRDLAKARPDIYSTAPHPLDECLAISNAWNDGGYYRNVMGRRIHGVEYGQGHQCDAGCRTRAAALGIRPDLAEPV